GQTCALPISAAKDFVHIHSMLQHRFVDETNHNASICLVFNHECLSIHFLSVRPRQGSAFQWNSMPTPLLARQIDFFANSDLHLGQYHQTIGPLNSTSFMQT